MGSAVGSSRMRLTTSWKVGWKLRFYAETARVLLTMTTDRRTYSAVLTYMRSLRCLGVTHRTPTLFSSVVLRARAPLLTDRL